MNWRFRMNEQANHEWFRRRRIVTIVVLVAAVALLRDRGGDAANPPGLNETSGLESSAIPQTSAPAVAKQATGVQQSSVTWSTSSDSATQPATYLEEQKPALLGAPQAIGETARRIRPDQYSAPAPRARMSSAQLLQAPQRQATRTSDHSNHLQRY